jgi:hypothetical protein
MRAKFASIAHNSTHAYLIETAYRPERSGGCALAEWAWMYETYGDGLTQHSGEWRVQKEHIIDFCASLAEYLVRLDPAERDAVAAEFRFKWPEETPEKDMEFAYSIRYNSEKPYRYYNLRERKVSSAESKQYDKRWQRIPDWADGSPMAMARLINTREYGPDLLDWFRLVSDCYTYVMRHDGWSPAPPKLLELPDPDGDLESRFNTVTAIVKSCELMAYATRSVEGYRENLQARAERAAKKEDAA